MTAYSYHDNLESARLLTRFLHTGDIAIWSEFFNDKEAVALLPSFGFTSNTDRAKNWIDRQLTRYKKNNFGLQALINKTTNDFIGLRGLVKQEVEGQIETEVGYHIFKKHWGKGYAPEAAKIFIEYAFNHNLADSIISIIDVRNTKSQRVADKNGLTREKLIEWLGNDVYIYRIHKYQPASLAG